MESYLRDGGSRLTDCEREAHYSFLPTAFEMPRYLNELPTSLQNQKRIDKQLHVRLASDEMSDFRKY